MTDGTAINSMQNGLLDAQAARLIQRVQSGSSAGAGAAHSKQDAKIEKSSKDFESILLSSWLQGAEGSFAKVPGGDDDDDEDSGKDQFQGIAMQALAGSMAANGGIGIAKMIAQSLRATEQAAPGETNRE